MKNLFKSIMPLASALALNSIAHASPIPSFQLWILDDRDVQPNEYAANTANYITDAGKTLQRLTLNVGDSNLRGDGTASARITASGGLFWSPGPTFHEFSSDIYMTNAHSESVCFLQIFNSGPGQGHPEIMLRMEPNGDIIFGDHGAHDIASLSTPNDIVPASNILARGLEGKNFNFRVRSNGLWQEVFINGKKVYAHKPYTSAANSRLDFHRCLYANEKINGQVQVKFWNMFRK